MQELEFSGYLPTVSDLVGFASATSRGDSDAAKFFFANETRAGKEPVSLEAQAILSVVNGTTDAFGKAYNLPAGSTEANPFGNARPLQTEPHFTAYSGKDFCGSVCNGRAFRGVGLVLPAGRL